MLHLYLLERVGETPYDAHAGFVVCASGPSQARNLARNHASTPEEVWRDPDLSTCVGIGDPKPNAKSGVVLADFVAG